MTQGSPHNPEWLAIREQHRVEVLDLQRDFKEREAALLAKQDWEAELYWRKYTDLMPQTPPPNAPLQESSAPIAKSSASEPEPNKSHNPAPQNVSSMPRLAKKESISHTLDKSIHGNLPPPQQDKKQQNSSARILVNSPKASVPQIKRELTEFWGTLNLPKDPEIIDLCSGGEDDDSVLASSVETTPQRRNANVSSSTPMDSKGVHASHLPSPSPSVTCTPIMPQERETETLLSAFKKPVLPFKAKGASSVHSSGTASTLAPALKSDKTATIHQQGSTVLRATSTSSSSSKKRRKIDLSDDDLSYYTPPSTLKTPSNSHGSPVKKIRLKTKMPQPTPRNTTPTPPIALPTTPPKRKAAVRAQTQIHHINEENKRFHTEDTIFQASTREARRKPPSTCKADLPTRLGTMSITPVPMGRLEVAKGSKHGALSRNIEEIDGADDDWEIDYGAFRHTGEIILQEGQDKRMNEV